MLNTHMRLKAAAAVLGLLALGALIRSAYSDEGFIDDKSYLSGADRAKALANNNCSVCHGVDGVSKWDFIPSLAGLDKTYIVDQLKGLRARARADRYAQAGMWGVAENLQDDEIDGLGDIYASMAPPKGRRAPRHADLTLGQSIFENGLSDRSVPACKTCHVGGRGDVNIPRVGGQHARYMKTTMKEFREGFRVNENMNFITSKMTDAEIRAVAAYMSTLNAPAAAQDQPSGN